MKLRKIDIENFRSIKKATIDFKTYPCRVLWGVNESGKSNLIKAMATLDDKYNIPQNSAQDKRLPSDDEDNFSNDFFVDFCFTLDDSELGEIYKKISPLFLCKNIESAKIIKQGQKQFTLKEIVWNTKNVVKRVDLDSATNTRGVLFYTGDFVLTPGADKETYEVINGWHSIPVQVLNIKTSAMGVIPKGSYKYIKFDDYKGHYADNETATIENSPFNLNEFRKLLRTEIENLVNAKIPTVISWDKLQDQVFHADINMQTFLGNPDAYPHFKSMCLLASKYFPNDDNAEIIKIFQDNTKANKLASLFNHIEAESTKYLQTIWDDFKNEKLVIDTSRANIIGISVKHSAEYANIIPTSYRSDGFKKFLKLMLTLSLKVKSNNIKDAIILIDEADTFLHPPAVEDFRDELIRLAGLNNNRVVFSTHSPFMIDDENIERHIIVEKPKETTETKDGEEGKFFREELLWKTMGCPILRALAEKTLILEGWDDKVLYNVGLQKLNDEQKKLLKPGPDAKLAIAHTGGAQHIRNCVVAFQAGDSKTIILCDSDKAGKDEQKHFADNKLWGCDSFFTFSDLGGLDDATAEDYLTDARIAYGVSKLKEEFAIDDDPDFKVANLRIMKQIKIWLKNKRFEGKTTQDDVIRKFKEFLFSGLKKNEIKDDFKIVLLKLGKKIAGLKKNAK